MFVFYLAVLSWIVLWKNHFAFRFMGLQFTFVDPNLQRSLNLIPFGGMLVLNGTPDYNEIFLNALIFVPFGVFLGMLRGKKPLGYLVLPIVLTSLLFESLQYALVLGASDITDVIANTAGGLIGLGLFFVFRKVCRDKAIPVMNTVALLSVVGFALVMSMVRPL